MVVLAESDRRIASAVTSDESVTADPGGSLAVPGHVDCHNPPSGRAERRSDAPPGIRIRGDPMDEKQRRVGWVAPGQEAPALATDVDGALLAWRR